MIDDKGPTPVEEYREGHEEEAPQDKPQPDRPEFEMAFLVTKDAKGIIDVITDMPGFPVVRKPKLTEVRDMANSVVSDVQAQIVSRLVGAELSASMKQIMSYQQNLAGLRGVVGKG